MIREFEEKDLDFIVDVAVNFQKENNLFEIIGGVNKEIYKNNIVSFHQKGLLKIWIVETDNQPQAALGITIGKDILSGATGINELFWYAKEQYRGKKENLLLLKKMEEYAEEIEAKYISMFHFVNFKQDKLEKYYLRHNYIKCQIQYFKDIKKGGGDGFR